MADVLDSGEDAAAEVIFGFFLGESDILRSVRLRGATEDANYWHKREVDWYKRGEDFEVV